MKRTYPALDKAKALDPRKVVVQPGAAGMQASREMTDLLGLLKRARNVIEFRTGRVQAMKVVRDVHAYIKRLERAEIVQGWAGKGNVKETVPFFGHIGYTKLIKDKVTPATMIVWEADNEQ